jgi:hypothetical protein
VYFILIILPVTQAQLVLSMLVAEIFVLSTPKYSFTIGSQNYFSLTIAAVMGMFFLFLFFALKFGNKVRFFEEKVFLGNGAATSIVEKQTLTSNTHAI